MTGYGKGEGNGYVVEMRSVNHKFLDLSMKFPRSLMAIENRIKKAVGDKFSRGRIEVFVTRGGREEAPKALRLDHDAARQYIGLLTELKNTYDLPGEVGMEMLASYREIVTEVDESEDADTIWAAIEAPLTASMTALDEMRAVEGAALAKDISDRAGLIALRVDQIEGRAPQVVSDYAVKLRDRIEKLAEGIDINQERLAQEVAMFADRSDITEEIIRARSHLVQLSGMLAEGGPIGRKLDFMLQELNRETNTIGSKASDKEICYMVVDIKGELEKIREQAQNIE
jgi:uncharacterized protein (TIGR00255 family)